MGWVYAVPGMVFLVSVVFFFGMVFVVPGRVCVVPIKVFWFKRCFGFPIGGFGFPAIYDRELAVVVRQGLLPLLLSLSLLVVVVPPRGSLAKKSWRGARGEGAAPPPKWTHLTSWSHGTRDSMLLLLLLLSWSSSWSSLLLLWLCCCYCCCCCCRCWCWWYRERREGKWMSY